MELQAVQNARLGFEKALTQYEYVLGKVREGTDAEPFYASGWEALFDRRGQRVDVMDTEKLDFFLIVGLADVFSVEKGSQVELMKRTCARGRGGVCRKKYWTGLLYGTIAWISAFLPRYLGMAASAGLVFWLSKRTGNLIHTVLLGSLALLLPVFLYLMGFMGEPPVSMLPLLTGYSMYRLSAGQLIYWCLALAAGVWFYIQTYEEGIGS